jgi:hypothetical protein
MHRASFAPGDPARTPTAKDFAVEGRPVEIAQPPWLTTGFIFASSGSGDIVGIVGGIGIIVPAGYASGHPLPDTSTYGDATFASLGATPGTYKWTWGTGAHADSFTLQIGPTAIIPEPSTWALMALGFAGLGLAGWRGRGVGASPSPPECPRQHRNWDRLGDRSTSLAAAASNTNDLAPEYGGAAVRHSGEKQAFALDQGRTAKNDPLSAPPGYARLPGLLDWPRPFSLESSPGPGQDLSRQRDQRLASEEGRPRDGLATNERARLKTQARNVSSD